MAYFQNIHSMADLKKEYRCLALQHHPDKGGDTAIMQRVNTEFEKLYGIWKDKPDVSAASTGYEHDYPGATAKEYTEYVYNEYPLERPQLQGTARAGNRGTGTGMAQGDLSGIQVLRQTGELPLHPYPVDESGFRGVHQRVWKSSRRCQPPSYPFRQILDGQGKRSNDEYLRFHHVVQFR